MANWTVTGKDGVTHVIDHDTWWSPCMSWSLKKAYGDGQSECERVEWTPRGMNVTEMGSGIKAYVAQSPAAVVVEHGSINSSNDVPINCLTCLVA